MHTIYFNYRFDATKLFVEQEGLNLFFLGMVRFFCLTKAPAVKDIHQNQHTKQTTTLELEIRRYYGFREIARFKVVFQGIVRFILFDRVL